MSDIVYPSRRLDSSTDSVTITGTVATDPDVNIHDAAGNNLTSQVNGTQRALDVGVNVAGVQVDPRAIRALDSATDSVTIAGTIVASNPSVSTTGTAVPASGTYIAVDVGGNLTGLVGTANGLKVDGSAVTQPVSGTVTVTQATAGNLNATVTGTVAATQSGTWDINNISGTVSLPTGAATSAKQPAFGVAGTSSADVLTVQGRAGMTPVSIAGTGTLSSVIVEGFSTGTGYPINVQFSTPPTIGGRNKVFIKTIDYSTTPVTTSAYTLLQSSTSATINQLTIADTSGSFLIIATGASGSEVDQLYIGPGGSDAPYQLRIASGTNVWIKALDTSATSGRLVVNALT